MSVSISGNRPSATVVITSKDRASLLRNAIESVLRQTIKCEIIVVDDGSRDCTGTLIPQLFPTVNFVRNETAMGIIAARNQAFDLISSEIVFTLDDDAVFGIPTGVEQVLKCFKHPEVGIVAISLVDHVNGVANPPRLPILETSEDLVVACDFSGGANAIRYDLLRSVGGYTGSGRQGEERGLHLRLLDIGYLICVAPNVHIDHYPQPSESKRILYFSCRNSILFGIQFVPFPAIVVHLCATAVNHFRLGWKQKELVEFLRGLFHGFSEGMRSVTLRKPVRYRTYRIYRMLLKHKWVRFSSLPSSFKQHFGKV